MKLGVLISGRGSNLQALIDACADPSFPAEIALVLSNRADAGGLERASKAGIPTGVVDHRAFSDRAQFDAALHSELTGRFVDLVCLAGFMRLLTADFVTRWLDRMINIHPSLLPAFKGLDTHERVLRAGVRFTGCTVHFVRSDMDSGPIIIQAATPVDPEDTAEGLAARVLRDEHRIYPEAVRLIAEGRVRVADERVLIERGGWMDDSAVNPEVGR